MSRFTPQLRALDWLVKRPIAHRGLHKKAEGIIENTASAFAGALAENYAIECDLQMSSDGEAMVFHDEKLDRLTEASGLVKHHTAKQLQRITIKNSGDQMQALGDMLDQVDGRVPLVIELKSHWDHSDALALRALEVLETYRGPYCLMSFDPDLVSAVAAYAPSTVRGITADRTVHPEYNQLPVQRRLDMQLFRHLETSRPHFVSFYFRDLPYAPVQAIRAAGHPIISWTIRSREQEVIARRYSDQVTFEGYAA
jgi:glycerophosphoryl diester phosphodiesterase